MKWGALSHGTASAPHLLCLQKGTHFGLEAGDRGKNTSLEGDDLTIAPLNLSLPPPKGLGTQQLMTLTGCRAGVPFLCSQPWAHPVPSTILAGKKA